MSLWWIRQTFEPYKRPWDITQGLFAVQATGLLVRRHSEGMSNEHEVDLREQVIKAISARLHVTTDRIPGVVQLKSGLSADTQAVVEAAEAVMPILAAERQAGRDENVDAVTRHS